MQTFIVDKSSVRDGKGVLRLSHESLSNQDLNGIAVLRNSIIDPITGSTNVRLLERLDVSRGRIRVICSDLTLPKPFGDEVLPITIAIHEKTEKSGDPDEYLRLSPCYYNCSDTGHLRGFYRRHYKQCTHDQPRISTIVNFVLDVTQDECTLGVGEVLLPERDHIKDLAYEVEISRFVTGGRLCLNSISTDDSDTDDSDSTGEDNTENNMTNYSNLGRVVVVMDIE